MSIIFRDELGTLIVAVDDNGISFADGTAYFTGKDGTDYSVSIWEILCIA